MLSVLVFLEPKPLKGRLDLFGRLSTISRCFSAAGFCPKHDKSTDEVWDSAGIWYGLKVENAGQRSTEGRSREK